jgi:uncharacterized protein DUF268
MVTRPNTPSERSRLERIARYLASRASINGIDLKRIMRSPFGMGRFVRDARRYAKLHRGMDKFRLRFAELYPCLSDYREESGTTRGHYFYQDLYFARKIFERRPERHVDIGSRIDGFVAHLLAFMPVDCVDIRPLRSEVEGLTFVRSDATRLREFETASVASLSSLHAAEHFGLGRFGDPIDPQGSFLFMAALTRVLAPGGHLYFSVPVGRERLEFNAHRVFAPETVLASFADLRLLSFSAVMDDGQLYPNIDSMQAAGAEYACGLFEFTK